MGDGRTKRYICPVAECEKKYSRPCLLRQHVLTHKDERPFQCPVNLCNKRFFRSSHLKVHIWTHSSTKPISCPICLKGFVTNQQLARHEKTHEMKDIICQNGDTRSNSIDFASNYCVLEETNEILKNDRKCPYINCDQIFTSEILLREHMLDTHVMSPIVPILEPNILPPLELIPSKEPVEGTSFGNIYNKFQNKICCDKNCQSELCDGLNSFLTGAELIAHYDWDHAYIPESLYKEESNSEMEFSEM